jgi:hypothetical protein
MDATSACWTPPFRGSLIASAPMSGKSGEFQRYAGRLKTDVFENTRYRESRPAPTPHGMTQEADPKVDTVTQTANVVQTTISAPATSRAAPTGRESRALTLARNVAAAALPQPCAQAVRHPPVRARRR